SVSAGTAPAEQRDRARRSAAPGPADADVARFGTDDGPPPVADLGVGVGPGATLEDHRSGGAKGDVNVSRHRRTRRPLAAVPYLGVRIRRASAERQPALPEVQRDVAGDGAAIAIKSDLCGG